MTAENDNSDEDTNGVAASSHPTAIAAPDTSPVPDLDWQTFRNYVVRAESGDRTVPDAFLRFVNSDSNGGSKTSKGDERRRQDYLLWQLLAENLRELDELIEMERLEHEQLLADLEGDNRILERFSRHRQGMERAEAYRNRHGMYEVNDNGELADADAEDMLEAWEKRTGRKLDRNNTEAIRSAFREQLKFEDDETLRLQVDMKNKQDRIGKLNEEIGALEKVERNARTALDNGENPAHLSADIQRQLLARGIGTDEQKRRLAEEQGISLSQVQAIQEINDDEWGPQMSSQFKQAARPTSPQTLEVAPAAAGLQTIAPLKR